MDLTDLYHFHNRYVNDYLSKASTAEKHVQTLEDPDYPIQPKISRYLRSFSLIVHWFSSGFD